MIPAQLFLEMWREAAAWKPSQRRGVSVLANSDIKKISDALSLQDEKLVCVKLQEILVNGPDKNTANYRAIILEMLKQIDSAFSEVHPRNGRRRGVSKWVMRAHENRIETGAYFFDDTSYVIACGPLSRANRGEHAYCADSLAERFSFLAVVPRLLQQDETSISIAIQYISDLSGDGVPPGPRGVGKEVICAVPIALERDELVAKKVERGDTSYVAFSAAPSLLAGEKVVQAVEHAARTLGGILDISIGSEFLLDSDAAASVLGRSNASRLFLLGTGASKELSDIGQPWNEAVVVNDLGQELWRQRKVWPASITKERAQSFKVNGAQPNGPQLFEDISAGDQIQIVDIEGLGRCVILICQDFIAKPLSGALLRKYQPDWVLAPILDRGMAEGNWFHREAIHYSSFTKARMIGVTSIALPREGAATSLSCVLAVCSMDGEGGVPAGAFACKTPLSGHPSYALVDFANEPWNRVAIVARNPSMT